VSIDDRLPRYLCERRHLIEIGAVLPAVEHRHFDERPWCSNRRRHCGSAHCAAQEIDVTRQRIEVNGDGTICGYDISDASQVLISDRHRNRNRSRIDVRIDDWLELEENRGVARVTHLNLEPANPESRIPNPGRVHASAFSSFR
jgi:hypothetical protein